MVGQMAEDNLRAYRRTLRLNISIPVVILGVDTDGNSFSENMHTQVINEHGGEIAMAHRVAVGTEVSVENRAMGVVAKAIVMSSGEKYHARDLHPVVLRLLEAKNVWGITFHPDDWRPWLGDRRRPCPHPLRCRFGLCQLWLTSG